MDRVQLSEILKGKITGLYNKGSVNILFGNVIDFLLQGFLLALLRLYISHLKCFRNALIGVIQALIDAYWCSVTRYGITS